MKIKLILEVDVNDVYKGTQFLKSKRACNKKIRETAQFLGDRRLNEDGWCSMDEANWEDWLKANLIEEGYLEELGDQTK